MSLRSLIVGAVLAVCGAVHAHDHKIGELYIDRAYARATVPGQQNGAVYLSIENKGKNGDKLIAVKSPNASSVEIHVMAMVGNLMKMREAHSIDLKPSTKVSMMPGDGYHLMLIGLKQPLQAGSRFPLTLSFEKAGKLDVSVLVEELK